MDTTQQTALKAAIGEIHSNLQQQIIDLHNKELQLTKDAINLIHVQERFHAENIKVREEAAAEKYARRLKEISDKHLDLLSKTLTAEIELMRQLALEDGIDPEAMDKAAQNFSNKLALIASTESANLSAASRLAQAMSETKFTMTPGHLFSAIGTAAREYLNDVPDNISAATYSIASSRNSSIASTVSSVVEEGNILLQLAQAMKDRAFERVTGIVTNILGLNLERASQRGSPSSSIASSAVLTQPYAATIRSNPSSISSNGSLSSSGSDMSKALSLDSRAISQRSVQTEGVSGIFNALGVRKSRSKSKKSRGPGGKAKQRSGKKNRKYTPK